MKFFLHSVFYLVILTSFLTAQDYIWLRTQNGSSLGGPIDVEKNNSDKVYYGTGSTIFRSTDRGETFQPFGISIPNSSAVKCIILKEDNPSTFIVAVESSPNDKIYKTTDAGQTWLLTNDQGQMSYFGIPVTKDPSHPDTLYTMIGNNFQRSTDFGSTWSTISSNFGPISAPCDIEVFKDTSIILIGDNGTGIFRSTDYGLTWSQTFSTSGEIPVIAIDHLNPGVAWATKWGGGGGFLKSIDYGATWIPIAQFNGINMWGVHVNPYDGNEVYAACYSCGNTWRTKDGGLSWLQIGISSTNYQVFVVDSMTVFSAQGNGIYKLNSPYFIPVELSAFSASVHNGNVLLSWSTVSELNNSGFEIERASSFNTRLSAGTSQLQEWEKTGFVEGYGTTTEKQDYNFLDNPSEYGIYLYRLKQIDFDGTFEYSNAAEVEFSAPAEFLLNQNYPNPFNPSTVISFQLSINSHVSLKVYDLLGNKIADLVNEFKPAGLHEIEFNAERLSSGIYFYKITAGEFLQIRKMSLIK
ncbi:MAG: T9SS type A sorting domain-containing protein [Ignavibacterium sp.]|nr:T9SS type A sorting domain-containing protein [Ignavibacterium sp.]